MIPYLLVLTLGCSLGYFLAATMFASSIRDDLARLDAERLELDEEREMLSRFWAMDVQPPVIEDVGAHKRIDRVLS